MTLAALATPPPHAARMLRRMQERYDRETQHGRNAAQQQRWSQILDASIQHAQTVLDGQAL
jgi:hypothetical protein